MSTQGIDIRQTTGRLLFRTSLKDADGAKVTSGTTELRVYRVEDDGTLDVYDWTTNDFVAPGAGTPDDETTMTHQQRRDSTGADVDTGVWTDVLSTLTNWTTGQVYIAQVTNTNASPESQEREFQFGSFEGENVYHADIHFTVDTANTQDEYTITWFKNGVRITAGITVPTLSVLKRADGTELLNAGPVTPTQIGASGSWKYDETTAANRMTAGESGVAVVTATIDAASRNFARVISRDA